MFHNLKVRAIDIDNTSWHEAIKMAIEREGCKGFTTGFRTVIDGFEYNNSNSNQDDMTYKACKMGLKIEKAEDFEIKLINL